MKILTLTLIMILTCIIINGQNLVGYKGKEIQKFMKEQHQDMSSEKVSNNRYNYLKYSDGGESETLLFFLNRDSICNSIKIICNPVRKSEKLKEFNSIYRISGENKWIDRRDGKDYIVELRDEKWTFVIVIEADK
jgi:uncharacterized protein YxeA